jgi:hypothetical protein
LTGAKKTPKTNPFRFLYLGFYLYRADNCHRIERRRRGAKENVKKKKLISADDRKDFKFLFIDSSIEKKENGTCVLYGRICVNVRGNNHKSKKKKKKTERNR